MPHQSVSNESHAHDEAMPCLVMITASSQVEATLLAHTLVEHYLAACVSITAIQSIYRWNGIICDDSEWQLIAKTDRRAVAEIEKTIVSTHSYDLPEIIVLPIIQGYEPYLKWIAQEVDV